MREQMLAEERLRSLGMAGGLRQVLEQWDRDGMVLPDQVRALRAMTGVGVHKDTLRNWLRRYRAATESRTATESRAATEGRPGADGRDLRLTAEAPDGMFVRGGLGGFH